MDRPKCETCPYFEADDPDRSRLGECHRRPPISQPNDDGHGIWRVVGGNDWCGEHPDFPAYLDALRVPSGNGDLSYESLSVRARKAIRRFTEETGKSIGQATRYDLMMLNYCGPATTREIVDWAAIQGMILRDQ